MVNNYFQKQAGKLFEQENDQVLVKLYFKHLSTRMYFHKFTHLGQVFGQFWSTFGALNEDSLYTVNQIQSTKVRCACS